MADSFADLGGGDIDRPTFQMPQTKDPWGRHREGTGPRDHNKLDKAGKRFGIPPLGQLRDMVCTHQIEQSRRRVALLEDPDGFYRVAHTTTVQFNRVNLAASLTSQCQSQPAQPFSPSAGCRPGLKGDWEAGMKTNRSRFNSSRAAWATRRCPRWTGSNEPP